jgi:hypothetical protein
MGLTKSTAQTGNAVHCTDMCESIRALQEGRKKAKASWQNQYKQKPLQQQAAAKGADKNLARKNLLAFIV